MRYLRSLPRLSAISLLISQAFITLPAFAAGYQLYENSPALQGSADAGAAASNNDVSAMFSNPATLANLKRNQFYMGGSEIMPSIRMSHGSATHTVNIPGAPPSSITAPVIGVTSQPSVSKAAFVPDGYFGWRLNDRVVAGFALVSPWGLTTKYYGDSVLRFGAVYSAVRAIDIVPTIAFDINEQLSGGLSFQAMYMKAAFTNFNGPYTSIPAIDSLVAATNPTNLKASGWGFGAIMGILFKPDLCTRIGLSYRTQISEQLSGDGQQYVSPGGTVPGPSPDFLFNAQTAVKAGTITPAVLSLGLARDLGDLTVKATAQMNFWNSLNQLTLHMPDAFGTSATFPFNWNNAWFASLGADYRANDVLTLRTGVAFDESPTRDGYRDPRIPDSDRYWLTFGASFKMTKHLSFDGAYEHIFFPDQHINVTQASGSSATSTVPLEVNQMYAKYSGSADVVGLAMRYSF